ncbi:hypothetical protein AAG747_01180 [Rapidithrix thailandica]|uniref:Uncharacterized protein n=1 Tax=Rapidithrix thailandica TaxID=413964 RepID=A0AAW9S2B3_9BACT
MNAKQFTPLMILLCTLLSLHASAQSYAFKVLGSKGEVTANGTPLKVGSTLSSSQTIKIAGTAYLGLAHNSGKTLEITQAGTYKVSELQKKVTSGNSSLAGQYAKLVINELTNAKAKNNRFNQRVKTGSVTRATLTESPVQMMLPESIKALDGNITLKWYLKEEADTSETVRYKITVKNIFRDVLLEAETEQSQFNLDLQDGELKGNKALLYTVTVVGNEKLSSDDHVIKRLSNKEKAEIDEALKAFPDDESAIGQLILGTYFEDKELYANSIYVFEKAIATSGIEEFKSYYQAFLDRNYLSKKSREQLAQKF